jgi:hypothetical protein
MNAEWLIASFDRIRGAPDAVAVFDASSCTLRCVESWLSRTRTMNHRRCYPA